MQAHDYFNQAVKLDTRFSSAFAALAYINTNFDVASEETSSESDFSQATDPAGHFALSRIMLFYKQYFAAQEIADRITQQPSLMHRFN
ncbi:MAG: hypothetical protein HRU06_01495 [Oceanospirillaceae bacterium]|nr:hypothetical protein [Oceanospirillaceae bacterium]